MTYVLPEGNWKKCWYLRQLNSEDMPIFMDRHDIAGVTANDVAKAHQMDLKVQDKYGCKALTYWFDEERGTAFCLIHARNRKAVEAMHNDAHGLIPNKIIEVEPGLVEAFLGRIEDPVPADDSGHNRYFPIVEPAYRSVLIARMNNAFPVHPGFTAKEYQEQSTICHELFDSTVHENRGWKTEVDVSGYLASFSSGTDAVHSAMEIIKRFDDLNSRTTGVTIRPGIGIGAGEPVSRRDDLFGEVIQEAARLSMAASGGYAVVSSGVKEQYRKENLGSFPASGILLSPDPADEDLFNRFMDAIEENWDSENVSLATLCRLTGTSRAQLYRKIKALTGRSAAGFLRNYRLDRARELLENRQGSVSQIAFASGFSNPSYFSKCFRKRFGVLPSAYGTLYA